jgi:hypothetical protein
MRTINVTLEFWRQFDERGRAVSWLMRHELEFSADVIDSEDNAVSNIRLLPGSCFSSLDLKVSDWQRVEEACWWKFLGEEDLGIAA